MPEGRSTVTWQSRDASLIKARIMCAIEAKMIDPTHPLTRGPVRLRAGISGASLTVYAISCSVTYNGSHWPRPTTLRSSTIARGANNCDWRHISSAQVGHNMLEILQFVFQDFWHWAGTFLMLAVVAEGLGGGVRIKTGYYKKRRVNPIRKVESME